MFGITYLLNSCLQDTEFGLERIGYNSNGSPEGVSRKSTEAQERLNKHTGEYEEKHRTMFAFGSRSSQVAGTEEDTSPKSESAISTSARSILSTFSQPKPFSYRK